MSSYDLEAALAEIDADERVKERIRRQVDPFTLGISHAFPPDPTTDWQPKWIRDYYKGIKDRKVTLARMGFTEKEIKPGEPRYITHCYSKPRSEAVARVLRRFGYGDIWPPLPAKPCDAGKGPDKFESDGIVSEEDYSKVMTDMWSYMWKRYTGSQDQITKYSRVLSKYVAGLPDEEPRGRREIQNGTDDDVKSDLLPQISEEELRTVLRKAWKKAVEDVRHDLKLDGTRLDLDSEEDMPLCTNPDLVWIKQHYRKACLHHDKGYIVPWVDFDPSCDVRGVTAPEGGNTTHEKEKARQDYYVSACRARAAFLAPGLNEADLVQRDNLIRFIFHRTQHAPSRYVRDDYEACHPGRACRILTGMFAPGITVGMNVLPEGPDPKEIDRYFHVREEFPNTIIVCRSCPGFQNYVTDTGQGPLDVQGKLFGTGEAQVVLLSHCLIYSFLSNVIRDLLFSLSLRNLSSFNEYLESKRPAEELERDLKRVTAAVAEYDANRQVYAVHRPEIYAKYDPHPAVFDPPTVFNPSFHSDLIQEKQSACEHLQNLFTDAQYFWEQFKMERDHHYGLINAVDEQEQLHHYQRDTSITWRWDLYYDIIGTMTRRAMLDCIMYEELLWPFSAYNKVKEEDPSQLEDWQGDIQCDMPVIIKEYFALYVKELQNRGVFAASPNFRQYFRRLGERSRYIDDKGRLLKGLLKLPQLPVEIHAGEDKYPSNVPEILQILHTMLGNPTAVSFMTMKKLLDEIRLMFVDESMSHLFTAPVRRIIDRMSSLIFFYHRLDPHGIHSKCHEHAGLFEGIGDDPEQPAASAHEGREMTRLYTPPVVDHPFHINVYYGIDDMIYEEWERVSLKRYHRIYSWIDEMTNTPEQAHGPREIEWELTNLYIGIQEAMSLWKRPNNLPGIMIGNTRDTRAMVPLVPEDVRQLIFGNVRVKKLEKPPSEETWEVPPPPSPRMPQKTPSSGHESNVAGRPTTPQTPAADPSRLDTGLSTAMDHDSAPGTPIQASAAAEDTTMTSDAPEERLSPSEKERRAQKLAARRHGALTRIDQRTLKISGEGRTRTTSGSRERRRQQREEKIDESRARRAAATAGPTEETEKDDEAGEEVEDVPSPPRHKGQPLLRKHWTTLKAWFREDRQKSVRWGEIASVMARMGYMMVQGDGSRVKFVSTPSCPWHNQKAEYGVLGFHQWHENSDIPPGMLNDFKDRLTSRGITLDFIRKHFEER